MPNPDEKIVKLHELSERRQSQAAAQEAGGPPAAKAEPTNQQASPSVDAFSWGKRAPNILTVLRILAVPVFVFLLTNPTQQSRLWATAIFVLASLTDWLDGYLARIYQAESILGTLLDPLADKVLVTAALVMLAADSGDMKVPAWIVVAMLSRDLLVTGLRSLAAVKGTVVSASRAAKHKTAWTMVAIVFLLVGGNYTIFSNQVNFHSVGMLALWIALILSVFSGLEYAIKLRRMFL